MCDWVVADWVGRIANPPKELKFGGVGGVGNGGVATSENGRFRFSDSLRPRKPTNPQQNWILWNFINLIDGDITYDTTNYVIVL